MTACALREPGAVMRHDPAAAAVVIMLRSLKMYGMAQAVTDLAEQGAPAFEASVPILCMRRFRPIDFAIAARLSTACLSL